MFMKQPRARRFVYRPYFYKKKEIEEEGPRIKFRRRMKSEPPRKKSLFGMVVLVIILIILMKYLAGLEKQDKAEFEFQDIKIEEVEGEIE